MIYERLVLIHELLAEDGSLYVHLGTNVSHAVKLILDEVFGTENYRNEIVWKRATTVKGNFGQGTKAWGPATESILFYSKSDAYTFNQPFTDYTPEYIATAYRHVEETTGRRYRLVSMIGPGGATKGNPQYEVMGVTRYWRYSKKTMDELIAAGLVVQPKPGAVPHRKYYLDEGKGVPVQSLWDDIGNLQASDSERIGYPTQKPKSLLERIISASSNPDDLVADFFVGSGTTAAVAERARTPLDRLRPRPLCDPHDAEAPPQHTRLPPVRHSRTSAPTSVSAGRSGPGTARCARTSTPSWPSTMPSPSMGFIHLHGRKADRMVHVGAHWMSPVTIDETEDVIDEMADNGIEACDLLGWEWEMGLHDTITERARRRGLDLPASSDSTGGHGLPGVRGGAVF